jgi:hypothetical protein
MGSAFHMCLERSEENDCYILYPCGHIATDSDVQNFEAEYNRVFAPLARKVDIVIVLDMFSVDPSILETWSHARKRMVEQYTNISVRVSSGGNLAFFLKKNAAKNSAYHDYEDDIVSAIRLLQEKRAKQERGEAVYTRTSTG